MKKILITGGSRGIGCALAEHFAKGGNTVCIVSRTKQVHEAAERLGVTALQGDIGHQGTVLVQRAATLLGGLDVIINAAGVFKIESTPHSPLDMLETNVVGAWRVCMIGARLLSAGGSIVLFSGGGVGGPNVGKDCLALYAASKAAVVQLAECMAMQFSRLRINAVAPGRVATEMRDGIGSSPEQTVACVDWLCSDAAKHVTGRLISATRDGEWNPKPSDPGPINGWQSTLIGNEWGKLRRFMP